MSDKEKTASKPKLLLPLALGALGVVYGDIGTSPLYAVKEIFFGHALATHTQADVIGTISLVFWALTIIVSFKYVIFVLRADHDGEGGVFSLYSLINQLNVRRFAPLLVLLTIGAGLLFGDGIITPAISVISAVEGLSVAASGLTPYIIPITIFILTLLFAVQKHGTDALGKFFGPIMVLWFASIAALGVPQIVQHPEILQAVNPMAMISFIASHDIRILFTVLGSVMLVVTGGEAMYADLGHFGRKPIRVSWFAVTYPSLLLNYFGQGAYMLSGQTVPNGNLFYSLVPQPLLFPMVILATFATVIASQALISGAFSLMTQAISLGLFPYLPVQHTNEHHHGQIYVSPVNWLLYIGAVTLVLYFQNSTRMAGAYGLAVSGVMFITTLGMIVIAERYWKWKLLKVICLFVPLLFIDAVFLSANSFKIFEGGYIPLTIAVLFMIGATTWQWGRAKVKKVFDYYPTMTVKELIAIKQKATDLETLPRTVIVMTPTPVKTEDDPVPTLKQIFWDRYGVLPKHLIFLTVQTMKEPIVHERYRVTNLYENTRKGSITAVTLRYGFMEDPKVEDALEGLARHKELNVDPDHHTWLIHAMEERLIMGPMSLWNYLRFYLYQFISNNAITADQYFGLGKDHPLTIETVPVVISGKKRFKLWVELVNETA